MNNILYNQIYLHEALCNAIQSGNLKKVNYYLNRIKLRSKTLGYALSMLEITNRYKLNSSISQQYFKRQPFLIATQHGHIDIVKRLLEFFQFDDKYFEIKSCIISAVEQENLEMLTLFLENSKAIYEQRYESSGIYEIISIASEHLTALNHLLNMPNVTKCLKIPSAEYKTSNGYINYWSQFAHAFKESRTPYLKLLEGASKKSNLDAFYRLLEAFQLSISVGSNDEAIYTLNRILIEIPQPKRIAFLTHWITNPIILFDNNTINATLKIVIASGCFETLNDFTKIPEVYTYIISDISSILLDIFSRREFSVAVKILEIIDISNCEAPTIVNTLHYTIWRGDLNSFNLLIKIPKVLEYIKNESIKVLCRSIFENRLDTTNVLLEIPEVLTAIVNDQSDKALYQAIENGCLLTFHRLLEIPEVLRRVTEQRINHIRCAIDKGHLNIVNRLLQIPEVLNNITICCNTALFWARFHRRHHIVERLMQIQAVRDYENGALIAQVRNRLNVPNVGQATLLQINTHTTSIHASTSDSAINLKINYGAIRSEKINFDWIFDDEGRMQELKKLLMLSANSVPGDKEIQTVILKALTLVTTSAAIDPVSDIKLDELLSLVQNGLDKQTDSNRENGYLRLLECLYLSQTEYAGAPSCPPGFFNNIVYSQYSILPEVVVVIQNKANAVETLKHMINQELDLILISQPKLNATQLQQAIHDNVNSITTRIMHAVVSEYYSVFDFETSIDADQVSDVKIEEISKTLTGLSLNNLFDYVDFDAAVTKLNAAKVENITTHTLNRKPFLDELITCTATKLQLGI